MGSEGNSFGEADRGLLTFSIFPAMLRAQGLAMDRETVFEFIIAKDDSDCISIPYHVVSGEGGLVRLVRTPSISPYSEDCFDQIRRWHRNCSDNHTMCRRRNIQLPKRLLDVLPHIRKIINSDGNDNCSDDEMGSLIETRTSTEPSRELLYIALSYCWGGWAGLITKKENLTRMMHSIPMDELPGAVRDAVLVCRKYGIRHLWVDALCICQDDPTEWSDEVS